MDESNAFLFLLRRTVAFLADDRRGRASTTSGSRPTAKSSISAEGAMTGVRHAWTFDDMFSAYGPSRQFARRKGQYTRE